MKTVDPHSLLTVPRMIESNGTITEVYQVWKNLMNEKTDSGRNDFDAFVSGFFLGTNSSLREKYLKLKPKENI